jgi:hypothetical protein
MKQKKESRLLSFCILLALSLQVFAQPSKYNVIWTSQSANSSESMPCGGGDIGLNVWVEDGDVLFYIARSGQFDENNSLLKSGRVRIRLNPNPFEGKDFKQELCLEDGSVRISAKNNQISSDIRIWVDVFNPVIHVETNNSKNISATVFYENWRYADRRVLKDESNQNSYKWTVPNDLLTKKDFVDFEQNSVLFYHKNEGKTIFDVTVDSQGMESVKSQLFNPLENLIFGGKMEASGFKVDGISEGKYTNTDYKAWQLSTVKPLKTWKLTVKLQTLQTANLSEWKAELDKKVVSNKKKNLAWWSEFWKRSFIYIESPDNENIGQEISRNYTLFRYQLACNAYGAYPTKFNGGLFTFDPVHIDSKRTFTPDFRNWGGGTFTAQNQRLVYFPMLKSGDFDMMTSQFEFYRRLQKNAELRSKFYWNHNGACFTEQIENFGLPNFAEYGTKRPDNFDKGVEYNAWLEYQWDSSLEFCFMILEKYFYTGEDISLYIPLIESCLRFFDEHYQYQAKQRGNKIFDGNGKLILFPGSSAETYKMAYNATPTIAALKIVAEKLLALPENYLPEENRNYFTEFLNRLPEILVKEKDGKKIIMPAWLWERENNTESPQLYPVFPWRMYGVGKPDLQTAINTYNDSAAVKYRGYISWKQDAIWAACLGLTDEAKELTIKKLKNSNRRFPTFWGPGFDWVPDHNWGGSGMIALQEMLLQTVDNDALILPAFPGDWNVHFRLHAPQNTVIECIYRNGKFEKLESNNKNFNLVTKNNIK